MRRLTVWALIWCGIGLLAVALCPVLTSTSVYAQDVDLEDADYVGARECSSCHRGLSRDHSETRHSLTLQDVSRDEDLILGDFEQGEDVRMVQFPGDDEPRPFDADDIAYALGTGRNVQRYLYEVDRNEFMVLPAQWNVNTQSWESYTVGDAWPGDAYAFGQNCAGCHTTGLDTRRFRWEDDGVQCETCHGPGSLHVEAAHDDEDIAVIHASIVLSPDPQICGQCHSQGTNPEDGLPYPTEYRPGQVDLLDESVFTLVPPDDSAHWWPTGHARQPNMQFNEWVVSAHAQSLNTLRESPRAEDTCLRCHSGDYRWTQTLIERTQAGDREGEAPEPAHLETAQFSITCVSCHNPHSEAEFLLVSESPQLCVECHTNPEPTGDFIHHPVREMFEGDSLVAGIGGIPGTHARAEDGPDCDTCHLPDVPVDMGSRASHTFDPIIPGAVVGGPPDSCSTCHEGLATTDLQFLVEDTQETVRQRLSVAFARLSSIVEPESDVPTREIYNQVVAALNFVQNDGSLGVHNYEYADALLTAAERGLTELSVPGATLQPTEAPAPTATPSGQAVTVITTGGRPTPSGVRPITVIVIGIVVVILLISARSLFRTARNQES